MVNQQNKKSFLGHLPPFVANPNPNIYTTGKFVVLDWETSNNDYGSALTIKNFIVCGVWYCSWSGEYKNTRDNNMDDLFSDLENCDFLVAHNAKFELHWLRRLGFDKHILIYDTMVGEYVLQGNLKVDLSLDGVAKSYDLEGKVSYVSQKLHEGVCPSTLPLQDVLDYCTGDVENTLGIFDEQCWELHRRRLLPVMYTRCLLTPVLVEIEKKGVALDRQRVYERYQEYNGKLADLVAALSELTGGINLNSPKQLGVYLYDTLRFEELTNRNGEPDRTEAGGRRTDADSIGKLKARTSEQRAFVELFSEYGSLKVNTKALEKLYECCKDTPTGQVPVLYAQYNQCVTATHRLSSSGLRYKLQFHNFNRLFKELFCARETGWKVGESDGIQLEFRVAAHLGRDPVAAADIRNPSFDAHYQTAEILEGKERSQISKAERTAAKADTFKPLFGGMSGTKRQREYYKFFQQRYAGIYRTQTGWAIKVSQTKKLVTETGLVFYWPDCKVGLDGYISNKTSIFNYPVQSLATADIIPIGLVCAYYRMVSMGFSGFLVNTVHDAIIAELPESETEAYRQICEVALTEDTFRYLKQVYNIEFTVPLGCETKIGAHWGDGPKQGGKEFVFNLDPVEGNFSETGWSKVA